MSVLLHPAPAFHFVVSLSGAPDGQDNAFKEVDGLQTERSVEDVVEGGENRFVHRLPLRPTASDLVLKRGILATDSPLRDWCVQALESDLGRPIEQKSLDILLLDETGSPSMAWSVLNAFPIGLEVGPLDAMSNTIAVETIKLAVQRIVRRGI